MKIKVNQIEMEVFENGDLVFKINDTKWQSDGKCALVFSESKIYFDDMTTSQSLVQSGIGEGIRTRYTVDNIEFETFVWIEYATSHVHLELTPIHFDKAFEAIYWPAAFKFDENKEDWITLINQMQGIMIPNTLESEVSDLHFHGQFCSSAAYMPWFSQVKGKQGYLMVSKTPWDSAYQMHHIKGKTSVSMRHLASLQRLRYRRLIELVFVEEASIVNICKTYRQMAKEEGKVVTLKEKAARNEKIHDFIGCAVLHKGIKTHVSKDSIFYDKENPDKNDCLIPFEKRAQEIVHLSDLGLKKAYLHLDGWAEPGYDNQHPDYLPACEQAGGWEGLKHLSDTLQERGYLFGLHDQYRDYYFDAPSFDPQWALKLEDNKIFEQCLWAGGRQSYLCATQAPYYVRRNFEEILSHDIHLDASYLDVFTCNEPDECLNEQHPMTRKECLAYRLNCFQYLESKNILPSSEEVNEWALSSLVFAHYGPYDFMLRKPDAPRIGIPVPLWNLVYHDCTILPWPMDVYEGGEDMMLYALLNGGIAYVDKDGAYPNTDGAFDDAKEKQLEEEIKRSQVVSALHEKVAMCEMVDFGFMSDYQHQYSVFSDGTRVEIDLKENIYKID